MHSSIKKYLFVAFLNYFGYDCAVRGMFDNTIFFAVLVSSFIKSKAWGYAINKQRIHTARSYIRLRTPIFKFIMRTRSQVNLIILLSKTPTIIVIYIFKAESIWVINSFFVHSVNANPWWDWSRVTKLEENTTRATLINNAANVLSIRKCIHLYWLENEERDFFMEVKGLFCRCKSKEQI